MDKPIAVGDLVVVVKPRACCGASDAVGSIYRVKGIFQDTSWCGLCGVRTAGIVADVGYGRGDITRLKRIPPLQELDSIKTQEEITA